MTGLNQLFPRVLEHLQDPSQPIVDVGSPELDGMYEMWTCVNVCASWINKVMFICLFLCTHVCSYVSVCLCVSQYVSVCTSPVDLSARTRAHVCVCVCCVCVCVYLCLQAVCIYIIQYVVREPAHCERSHLAWLHLLDFKCFVCLGPAQCSIEWTGHVSEVFVDLRLYINGRCVATKW